MSWISDHLKARSAPDASVPVRRAEDPVTGVPILPAIPTQLSAWDRLTLLTQTRTILKDKAMLEKLKSRKLWITVAVGAVATILNGIGVDQAYIGKLVALAATYIGGQSLVDAVASHAAGKSADANKPSDAP